MSKNTKIILGELLPKISEREWRVLKAATRAWSIRELSRLSGLPLSTVYRILKRFTEKGKFKFLIDFKKANLLPLIAVFPKLKIRVAPPFTRAVRVVYSMGSYTFVSALVPPPFIEKYLNSFSAEPIFVVKGYEYIMWSPLSPLTEYSVELKKPIPIFDFESLVKQYDYLVEPWSNGYRAPDIYDLVLLQGRVRNPFARPLTIYSEARRLDPSLPAVSEQVLSYHFNKHVKAMWRGNTALIYADTRVLPIKVYYFEGRDAPLFARLLCQLPGAFSAIIDIDRAAVIAQYPCIYEAYIMREAEYFKVEMPCLPFVQFGSSMVKKVPELWKFVEDNKWVFKEELAVKIRRAD